MMNNHKSGIALPWDDLYDTHVWNESLIKNILVIFVNTYFLWAFVKLKCFTDIL